MAEGFPQFPDMLQVIFNPRRFGGPEHDDIRMAHRVDGEIQVDAVGAGVGAREKDIHIADAELLTAPLDDGGIIAKALAQGIGDLLLQIEGIEFPGDLRGDDEAFGFSRRAAVARDQILKRAGSLVDVRILEREGVFREQQVGLETELGMFVGGLGELGAGLQERLAVRSRILHAEQALAAIQHDAQDLPAVQGCRGALQQGLAVADDVLVAAALAGRCGGLARFGQVLLQGGNRGFRDASRRCGRFLGMAEVRPDKKQNHPEAAEDVHIIFGRSGCNDGGWTG